jgi:CheY-like chemotaxis protein
VSEADGDAGSGRRDTHETASDGEEPSLEADAEDEPSLVLIVEDEEPIAEALAYIVQDAGYVPVIAAHGRQALKIARARRPALIITDLMMPLMDGAELIAALQADALDGKGPAPPVVLMTAGGMRRTQEVGANEVLRKPFTLEEVEELLHRYLPEGGSYPSKGNPTP